MTTIAFPSGPGSSSSPSVPTTPTQNPRQNRGAPHLPFRRISLPSGPPPILNLPSSPSSSNANANVNKRASIAGMPLPPGSSLIPAGYGYAPDVGRRSRRQSTQSVTGFASSNPAQVAKRARVAAELLSTERAYVAGLDLVYDHFLEPLLSSLPEDSVEGGILSRAEIDRVFSNFVNIWDLHRKAILPAFEVACLAGRRDSMPTSPAAPDVFTATPISQTPGDSALDSGPSTGGRTSFVDVPATPPRQTTSLPPHTPGTASFPVTPVRPGLDSPYPLSASFPAPAQPSAVPSLGATFVRHIPFLATYTPFVTSFGTTLEVLALHSSTSTEFNTWLKSREADPICKSLGLRDWLLTIIQRCPRYLLLIRDLLTTSPSSSDPEHALLVQAETMLSKLNSGLNTALATHGTTLSLLALQKACPSLPGEYRFVERGRRLLRRGGMRMVERGREAKGREFLLFNDALVWLESESAAMAGGSRSHSEPASSLEAPRFGPRRVPPSSFKATVPASPSKSALPTSPAGADDERWTFKGRADLLDIQVVVPVSRDSEEGARFEILSPDGSFACVAANETARDGWVTAIRTAKAAWLSSALNVAGDSTLTSSQSTKHLRRALQAIPAESDREAVEHFVEPLWVPDGKTSACMRCSKTFGLQAMGMGGYRRRHHCRLCGRVVCSSCSAKTFFIHDPKGEAVLPSAESTASLVEKLQDVRGHSPKSSFVKSRSLSSKTSLSSPSSAESNRGKPARACNACYDAVFQPKTGSSSGTGSNKHVTIGQSLPPSATMSMPALALAPTLEEPDEFGASSSSRMIFDPPRPSHVQEGSAASNRSSRSFGNPMRRSVSYQPGPYGGGGVYGSSSQVFAGSTGNLLHLGMGLAASGSTSNLLAGSSSSVNLLSGGGEGKSGFVSGGGGAGGAANRRSQALAASRRLSMPVVGLHTATVTTHTGTAMEERRLSAGPLPETTERLTELLQRSNNGKARA